MRCSLATESSPVGPGAPADAAKPVLATRGLVSGYGRMETLHGIDIEVPRG